MAFGHLGAVWFDLMAAVAAPHDPPDLGRSGVGERIMEGEHIDKRGKNP
jgi:hypothetical protein